MGSRKHEDLRYARVWARSHLRKGRCVLATLIATAGLVTLRHLYRTGYVSFRTPGLADPLWSYAHVDVSAIAFPPHEPTYLVFEPAVPISPSSGELGWIRGLPSHCRDAHFSSGLLCHAEPDPPLDVVWTWVNGSDRLLRDSMAKVAPVSNMRVATSRYNTRLFRDHDELRHSVRSVLQHFGAHTTQLHIVTSDFPIPIPIMDGDTPYNGTRRLGLVPRWLDPERVGHWRDGHVQLGLKYHSDIFQAYNGSSYNSYGIEAQLVNMQGVSNNFIYMNDDFFMMADMTAADFYTSVYGTVLRMQVDLLVKSNADPYVSVGGEWGPLEYTNWLLSNRFGSRRRPYTTHAAKSLSTSLMMELSYMWRPELAVTASHPFRGMKEKHRDVYSMYLFSHFLVERWREGLLWSWAVGKLGGLDDRWSESEKARAWNDVGGLPDERMLHVLSTRRTTMDEGVVQENLRAAGHTMSGKTRYIFASGDGYPYEYRNAEGTQAWPSFTLPPGEPLCKLDYQECFDRPDVHTASGFFTSIAFEKNRQCGDCIIHALRAASGAAGLAAFLPDAGRSYSAKRERRPEVDVPPHLPLVSDWRQGDFSLQSVIKSDEVDNVREWTLGMLERYRFVIGQTPTLFHQISSAAAARVKLKKVDEDKDVALLCLNDDMQGLSRLADRLLLAWQERRWGRKAQWER